MKEVGIALKAELVIPLVTTPGRGGVKDEERKHQQERRYASSPAGKVKRGVRDAPILVGCTDV